RGIIRIKNGVVVRQLILEYPRLRASVSLKGTVAVKVVGRKIQEDGNVRPERLDQFELKAAQFGDNVGAFIERINYTDERRADVAGKHCTQSCACENVSDQCRGGGLT